jgi:hypothetical protein
MADLVLFTRISVPGIGEENPGQVVSTCLFVYDEENFSDAALSNDIREQLELNPAIGRIYVLAPRVSSDEMLDQIRSGTSLIRTTQHEKPGEPILRIITASRESDKPLLLNEHHFLRDEKGNLQGVRRDLGANLVQGWLFDLFLAHRGMVLAPPGVHFGKTSGKHSDRFLRTANVLLSSAICRTIAFFCLSHIPPRAFRQIYVDTAPLMSVGLALVELCRFFGLTVEGGRIRSFSSYSGLTPGLELRDSDLVLVSASTSGGLVDRLLEHGANQDSVLTLFYLQATNFGRTQGKIVCDLTHEQGSHYGFAKVISYEHRKCPLCAKGVLLAEFEGDQFLLERRKTRRLKPTVKSQHSSARELLELCARQGIISVALNSSGRSKYPEIHFDLVKLAGRTSEARDAIAFQLRRSTPIPLDFIVSDDSTPAGIATLTAVGTRAGVSPRVLHYTSNNLSGATPIPNAGVLVYFSVLDSDLAARSINRTLRSVAPQGTISYVAALLVSESPEARRDLLTFLRYGERGPRTFDFNPVFEIQLSQRNERSPWELEHELLARLTPEGLPVELERRLQFLKNTAKSSADLFLPAQTGALKIGNNFVYLDTTLDGEISQADVYAVVANLLAARRNDDRELEKPLPRGDDSQLWEASVYGQTLLCPRNFKDYNDGVLHSAFIRAARTSELRYDTDPLISAEITEIILGEIEAWQHQGGQALGEILIAIATRRLSLVSKDLESVMQAIGVSSHLPDWIKFLANACSDG